MSDPVATAKVLLRQRDEALEKVKELTDRVAELKKEVASLRAVLSGLESFTGAKSYSDSKWDELNKYLQAMNGG